jgi:hypothetical protein
MVCEGTDDMDSDDNGAVEQDKFFIVFFFIATAAKEQ